MIANDRPSILDSQFCFALYSAMHSVTRAYRPVLDELGLTYPQYLVMLVLWEEGAQSVGGLAARLQLESSTLTPLLKRLESRGLVCRRRQTEDERRLVLSLTAEGDALRARAQALPAALLGAVGCSPADIEVIRDRLTEIRDSIDSALREARG